MNKLQKLALVSGTVLITGLFGFLFGKYDVVPDKVEEFLGGGNLPDRCEVFDQVTSRSSKDTVKAAEGTVYSVTVSSTATNIRYFQLHDQATNPTGASTPEVSIPIAGTTSSNTPTFLDYKPAVPIKFNTGIAFALSTAFATFATQSDQLYRNSLFVTICYQ